ncbi:MAG TPA: ribonuclease III domain-containing protein [Drouetiella sp.]
MKDVPLRSLAHLGDAVFHLFEREREVTRAHSANQMHKRARVKATQQAELLQILVPHLTEEESDIVRRARNMKATGFRKVDQNSYRHATAFEALLGFLYLTNFERMKQLLRMTEQPQI